MKLISAFVVLFFPVLVSAAIIRVPVDQPTVQAGIDAAASGDTVLVAPGRYLENIHFGGKLLHLLSEKGADSTVLEGVASAAPVVRIGDGEPAGVELRGFTITRGTQCGVLCAGGSPRIIDNIIVLNERLDDPYGVAGLSLQHTTAAVIKGNFFFFNGDGLGLELGIGGDNARSLYDTICYNVFANAGNGALIISGPTFYCAIFNNTFVNSLNNINLYGYTTADIRNNIIAGYYYNGYCDGYSSCGVNNQSSMTVTAQYNCFHLGLPAFSLNLDSTNILVDPLLVDSGCVGFPDRRLLPASPCINAGDPDPKYNDAHGSRNDIGALPFTEWTEPVIATTPYGAAQQIIRNDFKLTHINWHAGTKIYDSAFVAALIFPASPDSLSYSPDSLACTVSGQFGTCGVRRHDWGFRTQVRHLDASWTNGDSLLWTHTGPMECGCCIGERGNVNLVGIVDLADLSLLIAYLTVQPPLALPCAEEANVNNTGIVDLSDLSTLIAYLTQPTGTVTLPWCP